MALVVALTLVVAAALEAALAPLDWERYSMRRSCRRRLMLPVPAARQR